MAEHFIGVDVGTGSARAGVFDAVGTMLASAKADIRLWREAGDMVEQSSNDIWRAVCTRVREAVAAAGVSPSDMQPGMSGYSMRNPPPSSRERGRIVNG